MVTKLWLQQRRFTSLTKKALTIAYAKVRQCGDKDAMPGNHEASKLSFIISNGRTGLSGTSRTHPPKRFLS